MLNILKVSILIFMSLVVLLGNSGAAQAADLTDQQRKEQALQKNSFYAQNDVLYTGQGCGTQASSSELEGSGSSGSDVEVDCGVNKGNDKGNKDKVWNFLIGKFKGKGYSQDEAEKAAAGVMGNWMQESSVNSHLTNAGMGCNDSPAYGIAQWCFGRIDKLKSFAKEKGKEPTCLGVQLAFMWSEMEGPYSGLIPLMKGVSPSEAAHLFNLGNGTVGGFEVGHDDNKRQNFANIIYKEYTGKGPGGSAGLPGTSSVAESSGSGSESEGEAEASEEECPTEEEADTNVPGDCGGLVEEVEKLHKSGKLIMPQKPNQDKDLKNCTDGQVECGTDGGKGGVKKKFLQSFVTIIKAAPGPVTLWNMNTGHMCDGLNHPKGKAVDIPCGGGTTPIEVCKKMIDFAISNKGTLGLTEILWQQNYRCGDGVDCSVGGHDDHIHFGVGGA